MLLYNGGAEAKLGCTCHCEGYCWNGVGHVTFFVRSPSPFSYLSQKLAEKVCRECSVFASL